MSLRGEDALILAMDYTEQTLKGQGALKGEDGISPTISVNTSTSDVYKLDITDKNGTITTPNLVGKQGERGEVGETGADGETPTITENADNTEEVYKLDFTTKNGTFTTKNIIGKQGLEGVSPSVTTNPDNTAEDYRLNITTKGGTFTTPNLRGPQGEIGPQGESAASAINPRGDYDVNAEPHYAISDYITSAEGNTYVCKKDNPDNVAPTDGTINDEFWQVLALRGAKGEAGKDGEKGADGVTFTPRIDANGVLSFTNNGGLENPEPIDIKGDNGVTFTPSIDADGYLSFTNNGNLENPEPIKVLGKDGVDGKDGADGTTYIPSIGTVTTVESNADASAGVTVDEETKEAVFNFAIPKGEKGLDSVQISDNETVEDKTWSSKKTSDEIAEVETELNAKLGDKADKTDLDGSKKLYITNTDANIKFVKTTSAPLNGSSIDIHFKSARTNTTFEEETVRVSAYVSKTIYDGKIIQKGLYASNGNKPNENEANFLVILDDYSVWAHIASYSTAEIELYSYGRKQSIDGTEATTLPSEVKYSMFNGVELATMDKVIETIANPTELDANKYIKNGFYSIGDATERTNLPMQNVGTLLVYYAGHYVIQEYILNANLRRFMRRSTDKGANWSAWQEIATKDYVDSKIADLQAQIDALK